MGLTLIRKSRGLPPKRNPKIALVLAGGAVSGGAFKVGGLKALDDFLVERKHHRLRHLRRSLGRLDPRGRARRRRVAERDGEGARRHQPPHGHAAAGRLLQPELARVRDAARRSCSTTSSRSCPASAPIWCARCRRCPTRSRSPLAVFAREPSYANFELAAMALLQHVSPTREIPALTNHIPSGLFDNASLERWLRRNLERMRIPNDFRGFSRKRGCDLYVTACDLDTAERETFGPDERNDISISEAVQASTALPLFYKPARINGVDYVDGGVRRTANIDVAIEKGCDLIICYNPFRPFLNRIDAEGGDTPYFANGRYLADRGMKMVLNQVFRTLLHSRLKLGLQRYLTDDRFQGDILLLEPRERDTEFFNVNPLAFWKRAGRDPPRLRVGAPHDRAELRDRAGSARSLRARDESRRRATPRRSRARRARLGAAGARTARAAARTHAVAPRPHRSRLTETADVQLGDRSVEGWPRGVESARIRPNLRPTPRTRFAVSPLLPRTLGPKCWVRPGSWRSHDGSETAHVYAGRPPPLHAGRVPLDRRQSRRVRRSPERRAGAARRSQRQRRRTARSPRRRNLVGRERPRSLRRADQPTDSRPRSRAPLARSARARRARRGFRARRRRRARRARRRSLQPVQPLRRRRARRLRRRLRRRPAAADARARAFT